VTDDGEQAYFTLLRTALSRRDPRLDLLAAAVGEVLGLWIHTADSRTEWTHRLIRRLEDGAFHMAHEGQDG